MNNSLRLKKGNRDFDVVCIFDRDWPYSISRPSEQTSLFGVVFFVSFSNCQFSHDVTKFQTSELLILPRFYFHDL